MLSYRTKRALRVEDVTALEVNLLAWGLALPLGAAIAAAATGDAGGRYRALGIAGIAALVACAALRGARTLRAGTPGSLPRAIGRTAVRIRPARGFGAAAVGLSVGLPLAVAATLLALVEWAWLPIAAILLAGGLHTIANWLESAGETPWVSPAAPDVEAMLLRLCMRADMTVPELVSEPYGIAMAWTSRGRIHVTTGLVRLLDDRELEAVLAHEVAHLARRDAAVMEICAAPSRVLLSYAALVPRQPGILPASFSAVAGIGTWLLALLCVPPALALGWLSRLSALGASRAREHAADAAAAALTGRPSALASALLKIEADGVWAPQDDLRHGSAIAMLCIVGPARERLGRLLSTHPPTAERVRRLERIEARLRTFGPPQP